MRALILPRAPIPEFIVVGLRKVCIAHRDQIQKCFMCRKEGHLKKECPLLDVDRSGKGGEQGETFDNSGGITSLDECNEDVLVDHVVEGVVGFPNQGHPTISRGQGGFRE